MPPLVFTRGHAGRMGAWGVVRKGKGSVGCSGSLGNE
jgi:hypothetical protein